MRNTLAFIVAVLVIGVSTGGWVVAQQGRAVPVSAQMEDVLKDVRADLQGDRADVIAKNVTLSSEQAAKFWPMFATYQNEQNVIMDEQMKGIQQYIENFEGLDDAGALALINAHFDRDARMTALRRKWLAEFQNTLGAKLAVRVMQIDRRLSLAHQLYFASKIPLSY